MNNTGVPYPYLYSVLNIQLITHFICEIHTRIVIFLKCKQVEVSDGPLHHWGGGGVAVQKYLDKLAAPEPLLWNGAEVKNRGIIRFDSGIRKLNYHTK